MRKTSAFLVIATVIAAAGCHDAAPSGALGTSAQALSWGLEGNLAPLDQPDGAEFGYALDVDGSSVVVGAFGDDVVGINSGAAYVFVQSAGWIQQAKLIPADGASSDEFGYTVAIDGDTVFAGAYQDDDNGPNSGSAYVFTRNGALWSQAQKLVASDGTTYDNFGVEVAIDGDTAAIGAHQDGETAGAAGSVYLFTRNAQGVWSQHQKLLASDGAPVDLFGRALALEGNTLVVGAQRDDDMGSNSGSAYVFTCDAQGGWSEQQKLTAFDGGVEDNFGFAVDLSGDWLAVGAHQNGAVATDAGATYLFSRDAQGAFIFQQKLTASDGQAGDRFGRELALDGTMLVVGAWGDDDQGADSGSVYAFERNGQGVWNQAQKLLRPGGVANDFMGRAVALRGEHAVIGAYGAFSGNGLAVAFGTGYGLGDACATDVDCASGWCVDGVCCDGLCDGGCDRCDQAGLEGACTPLAAGELGDRACAPYLCNGASTCPATCEVNTDCALGYHCRASACTPDVGPEGSGTGGTGGTGGTDASTSAGAAAMGAGGEQAASTGATGGASPTAPSGSSSQGGCQLGGSGGLAPEHLLWVALVLAAVVYRRRSGWGATRANILARIRFAP